MGAAQERGLGEGDGPLGLERVAHGFDAAALGDVGDGGRDSWEKMRVFVGVDMGNVDAGALEALDLGLGFTRELGRPDGIAHRGLGEVDDGRPEGFTVGAEQRGDVFRVRERDAVDENQVAADAERGVCMGVGDGVGEGGTGSHEGGGGEGTGLVELGDGAVDAGCETEVVCIEDEAEGHGLIVEGSRTELVLEFCYRQEMYRWVGLLGLGGMAAGAQGAAPAPAPVQQQVTVTASRSDSPVGETARTTYTLSESDLRGYPAVTLDDALRQHAGFELFRRAPSRIANPTSEGISLRGLGSTAASRTLVLEDGAPLNDPFGGWIHWSENPVQLIHSVGIVSGGGSDLYGSSALGGVIDVTPGRAAPARLEVSAAGGSQDTSDVQASGSVVGRALSMLAGGQSVRTAGYVVTDPFVAGAVDVPANERSQAYRVELGRRGAETKRIFATGNLLNEDHGNGTPLQTNATRLWRYLAGYDLPAGRVRVFGSQEGYRQSFSAIAATRATETLSRLQRVHTQELGATGDGAAHLGPVALVAGADVRDIRGEDNETPIAGGVPNGLQDVSARQRFLGGFGELVGARGRWSGAASLRLDGSSNLDSVQTTATTYTQPADRTEVLLSPRVGVVRGFGHASVHASAFRAFRAPTMNELYRTGQVGQEITQANAGLLSERATGVEAGAQVAGRLGSVSGTYFWTAINRPVSAVLVSQTATTITNRRQNLGQIVSSGVELAAQLRPGKAVSASLGYQFAAATVTKFAAQPALVGNQIPQVPRQTGTAQLRFAGVRAGEITVAVRSSGTAYDDASNRFPLAGFFSLEVSGRRALGRGAEVFFQVQNVTNQRAQVARTPLLTLGSPVFGEAGVRWRK